MTLNEMTAAINEAKGNGFSGDYVGVYGISLAEAERIASLSDSAEDFVDHWENEYWWTDEANRNDI